MPNYMEAVRDDENDDDDNSHGHVDDDDEDELGIDDEPAYIQDKGALEQRLDAALDAIDANIPRVIAELKEAGAYVNSIDDEHTPVKLQNVPSLRLLSLVAYDAKELSDQHKGRAYCIDDNILGTVMRSVDDFLLYMEFDREDDLVISYRRYYGDYDNRMEADA